MKRVLLTIAGIWMTANTALATSPILPEIKDFDQKSVSIANLLLNKTVTDCIKQTEETGLSAAIDSITLEEYNDVAYYAFSGRLMGIDTVEGSWFARVAVSYNQPPFGSTGYTCDLVAAEEF